MKFDKLFSEYLTEAIKGQITGHVAKQSIGDINPEEKIKSFLTTKNPNDLIDVVTFAKDKMNVTVKFAKKALAGEALLNEIKNELFETFELKKGQKPPVSKKILIPLVQYKDKSTDEVKTGLAGSNANYFLMPFSMSNPSLPPREVVGKIGAWYKLANLLFSEYERPSDIRQEGEGTDTRKVSFQYKDVNNNIVNGSITVRNKDNSITGDPLSSPQFFKKKQPMAARNMDYRDFKERAGGTLDNFITAIKGKIINDPKP